VSEVEHPMLEIDRLTRKFGVKAAVAEVSLQIEKGS
jgi:ABC-type Fe3+/spermidine/putrescine transport system ATPase subunit